MLTISDSILKNVERPPMLSAFKVEKPLIILPTYNEADNIIQIINTINALPLQISILVVDDSSPDGTAEKVTRHPSFEKNLFLIKKALHFQHLIG